MATWINLVLSALACIFFTLSSSIAASQEVTRIRTTLAQAVHSFAASSRQEVQDLQTALSDFGYDSTPIDGILGPKTIAALQRYLADEGYDPGPIDGIFGPRTWAALRTRFEHSGVPVPLLNASGPTLVWLIHRTILAEAAAVEMSPEPDPVEIVELSGDGGLREPSGTLLTTRGHQLIDVYFATDRRRQQTQNPKKWFTGERARLHEGTFLHYGIAEVSIPRNHQIGALESPRWWRLEFSENPDRHVVLVDAQLLPEDGFFSRVGDALGRSNEPGGQDILVFLHGYNVSFVDAVRRTGQIAYDLQFAGLPVLFSWPSEGKTLKYPVDEGNTLWARAHFLQFLEDILTRTGAKTVHVMAHSMGNRVLTEALRDFDATRLQQEAARLRNIIFAAPDVDADVFRQLARYFHGDAERITLYTSKNDKALKTSQSIHRYPRAGDSSDGLVLVDGVDTIDASALKTDFLGHSYYGNNESIISDIKKLLESAVDPDSRGLKQRLLSGQQYWDFGAR